MMTHPAHELVALAYRFYPRGLWVDDPCYDASEEHRRLLDARQRATEEIGRFRAMLDRVRVRAPTCPVKHRLFLVPSDMDACLYAKLILPSVKPEEGEHALGMMVSVLVHYYVLYSSFYLFNDDADTAGRPRHSLDLLPEEEPYGKAVADEIEATLGYERMLPDVANVIVPDVCAGNKSFGKATLLHCFFTDQMW